MGAMWPGERATNENNLCDSDTQSSKLLALSLLRVWPHVDVVRHVWLRLGVVVRGSVCVCVSVHAAVTMRLYAHACENGIVSLQPCVFACGGK